MTKLEQVWVESIYEEYLDSHCEQEKTNEAGNLVRGIQVSPNDRLFHGIPSDVHFVLLETNKEDFVRCRAVSKAEFDLEFKNEEHDDQRTKKVREPARVGSITLR